MIWPSVRDRFVSFTAGFEGTVPHFYLDYHHDPDGTLNPLVTIAIGNLVDPISSALVLPMLHADGSPASVIDIRNEWLRVKGATSMARLGGGAFSRITTLHLDAAGIEALVWAKEQLNDAALERRWASFATWPADAQLGALSDAWAAGSAWWAPKLDAAMNAPGGPDFDLAAGPEGDASVRPECRGEAWLGNNGKPGANPINPGLLPRNLATKLCFENAAVVASMSTLYDPSVLHWPDRLSI
jgi:hypothetical protein